MKRLFSDEGYESYSEEARHISASLETYLAPLVKKYSDDGYSLRELQYVLTEAVNMAVVCELLTRNAEKSKQESAERRARMEERVRERNGN